MVCSHCGTDNPNNAQNCSNCGAALQASPQQSYSNPAYNDQPVKTEDYRPISMWGYFGYEILFSIPIIGFIMLLVFSFGGTRNVNVKNFARSYFCYFIIVAIIAVILIIAIASAGGLAYLSSQA
ncbi:MAG: zinc-ribbon domain-containing protein [Oscillospiraceae bacterium]